MSETRLLHEVQITKGEFQRVVGETTELKRSLLGIGFPAEASRRALIAAYELAMNIIIHADSGTISLSWEAGKIEIVAKDTGPGIRDIALAMKEGYSTAPEYVREMGYGAGMGLPNARKSSDDFHIESEVGRGTEVRCTFVPGPADLQAGVYFHSVQLDADKCKGCTNCIKSCPTEAIRVRAGKAFILEDRCIDCGECIRRCPNLAKSAVSDSWDILQSFDHTIALIPPSFYGVFRGLTPDKIRAALVAPGGFDEVFDVSVAADLCSAAMRDYVQKRPGQGPFISASCPAVVRLIQVKYPSLLKQIIPCEAPMEVAAWLAKDRAAKHGPVRHPAVIFISPCPAKITAARQPVGRGRSLVDAVVSAADARLWVIEHAGGDEGAQVPPFPQSSSLGIGWGRRGGEADAVGLKALYVDGIERVPWLLDELESNSLDEQVDFVELQACPGGCVGGCLYAVNPFASSMRLRQVVDEVAGVEEATSAKVSPSVIAAPSAPELWFSLDLYPRPIFRLDADPVKAKEKLQVVAELLECLPGLDCGACGAPTCRALAEDIVLGRGSLAECMFRKEACP